MLLADCLLFSESSLPEKSPNTELFRVRIFLYLDSIRTFTKTIKYGPEITPYLDTFHAVVKALSTSWDKTWFNENKFYLSLISDQVRK